MTFKQRAKMLKARAADAKAAPMFQRAQMAGDLVDDVTNFLVDLSAHVDDLHSELIHHRRVTSELQEGFENGNAA